MRRAYIIAIIIIIVIILIICWKRKSKKVNDNPQNEDRQVFEASILKGMFDKASENLKIRDKIRAELTKDGNFTNQQADAFIDALNEARSGLRA